MQKLFRGGTIANTLNDVPRCIKEMIKENYKKIAIQEIKKYFTLRSGSTSFSETIKFTKLTFSPSKIYLTLNITWENGKKDRLSLDNETTSLDDIFIAYGANNNYNLKIRLYSLSEQEMYIVISNGHASSSPSPITVGIEEVIFIE